MVFQWVFFLPVILPLCMIFGALRGAAQMAERVVEQIRADVLPQNEAQPTID